MVDALERQRVQRVVAGHVAARALHQRPVLLRHVLAADGVEQHVDAHASATALSQGLRHVAGDVALLIDEVREGDRRRRAADRLEHRRKDLFAVEENLRAVAAHELGVGVSLERSHEGRLADRDIRRGVVRARQRAR